jgi:Heterokaryon incompatibility protein (HET)
MKENEDQTRFQYQALPRQNSIRLLSLMPGIGDKKLAFSFIVAEFISGARSSTNYEALSYTWGDAAKKHEAWCLGFSLPVNASLHAALCCLRYPDRSRTLWVDAICINQDDLEERASQVFLMQLIYTQADRIIIWLGVDDDLTKTAIAALERLYRLVNSSPPSQPLLSGQQFSDTSENLPLSRIETVAIARFFQRPWYKRVWVVQEAVSATSSTVVCGTCTIEWKHLATVCQSDVLHAAVRVSAAMIRASPDILAAQRIQKLRQLDCQLPLLSLLVSTRILDATDPRDKILAIQHLAREEDARAVVDYHSPVPNIYARFATKSLHSTSLDILSAVNPSGIQIPSKMSSLPSWVPDWSVKPDFTNYPGEHLPLTVAAHHFQASGFSAPVFKVSESIGILTVRGAEIDSIQMLSPSGWGSSRWDDSFAALDFEFNTSDNYKSDRSRMPSWRSVHDNDLDRSEDHLGKSEPNHIFHPLEASETGDDRLGALLEVLVCDTDQNGDRLFPRRLKPHQMFMKAEGANLPHLPFFMQQPIFLPPLLRRIRDMSWGRRFCSTGAGYMGWVPQNAQIGDIICYFLGGKVLYLLRPGHEANYTFIGECYLHGLMHGEALDIVGLKSQDFSLR